ncbi:MAG: trimeric intracellular cation channel family protein [Butyrivibrio sp.]|nr:trimeric intracellular cation channel family protein [Butyrivibrio sp.]
MSFSLLEIFDLIGTIAFAISGAFTGIQKKMDIFGVNILAICTACGGGLMRDIIIGNIPPQMFVDPFYVAIAAIVANVVFLFMYMEKELPGKHANIYDFVFFVFDTIGLAAFMVDGATIGVRAGYGNNAFLLIFLGFITGVGGGLLRDILSLKMPAIFVKHVYALAVIVGGISLIISHMICHIWQISMIIGFSVVILIRCLARHFLWNLPKVPDKS